jgi:hypothetical protein
VLVLFIFLTLPISRVFAEGNDQTTNYSLAINNSGTNSTFSGEQINALASTGAQTNSSLTSPIAGPDFLSILELIAFVGFSFFTLKRAIKKL